jgi:pimeloyl-ACP methyl ester carboxylesterase
MDTISPADERTLRVPTRLGALHVRTTGAGQPTILWPSMFVDSHAWDLLLPHLETGRQYVLVDGPGLGLSDPLTRASNIDEAAGAALDLLDELSITDPVDWVGNAFGGHVGYKLATQAGVLRSLAALSSPTEPISDALRRRIGLLRPLLRTVGVVGPVRRAIVDAMLTEASQADPRVNRIVLDSIGRPSRASMARALESFILNRLDVNAELGDIRVPSLFVATDDRGDWSPVDAANAAARTPVAQLEIVPGARTLIPLEQPAATAELLHGFWAGL